MEILTEKVVSDQRHQEDTDQTISVTMFSSNQEATAPETERENDQKKERSS